MLRDLSSCLEQSIRASRLYNSYPFPARLINRHMTPMHKNICHRWNVAVTLNFRQKADQEQTVELDSLIVNAQVRVIVTLMEKLLTPMFLQRPSSTSFCRPAGDPSSINRLMWSMKGARHRLWPLTGYSVAIDRI